MTFFDQLKVALTILSVVLAMEYYAWRVIYRKEKYKDTLEAVLRLTKKTGLSQPDTDEGKRQAKKGSFLAKDLRTKSMLLFQLKYKTMMPLAIFYELKLGWAAGGDAAFHSKPVRENVQQRGLEVSSDAAVATGFSDTACSLTFFFMVCSLALKENVNRFLGHSIPRGIENPIYAGAKEMEGKLSKRWGLDAS
eukprot:CAMPEP_0171819192 /NCGR_PEP_ID=MMETSP0992-20121227/2069_1 /TAXON_ID=483369 /ORGANISM="non described non described, Strain CCMP2098" /LENGTH=192 /DNA_ID=CAMNT_0012433433 /DNA_START=32 /DNA_END=612 /DNA_ORIENTATION=-